MDIIQEELEQVKNRLSDSISDPMPDNAIYNFATKGSKMVRSILAILYVKAYNKELTDNAVNVITAGEIIHNASLLHDDVVDNAKNRRGKTTIAQNYSPKLSILAGDYLISEALENILDTNNDIIINIFKTCIKNMTKAEINQLLLRHKKTNFDEYIEICAGKTASLFGAMLKSTAILSGIDCTDAEGFGQLFGIAFQIRNDLNTDSAEEDKSNGIETAKDILGIEKTLTLLDNYKGKMRERLTALPDNMYKEALEELVTNL